MLEALPLRGRSILIVEDEPLIALDLEVFFHRAGAKVLSTCTLERALELADRAGLSAAVLDYGISGGNCEPICARLQQRRIPFVIYSGYAGLSEKFPDAVIIPKPAGLYDVLDAVSALVGAKRLIVPSLPR
jgi:DNA-binding NtrC family response regulator